MSSVEIINSSDVLDRFGLLLLTLPCNSLYQGVVRKSEKNLCGEIEDYPIVFHTEQWAELELKVNLNPSFYERLNDEEQMAAIQAVFSQDLGIYRGGVFVNYGFKRVGQNRKELEDLIENIVLDK